MNLHRSQETSAKKANHRLILAVVWSRHWRGGAGRKKRFCQNCQLVQDFKGQQWRQIPGAPIWKAWPRPKIMKTLGRNTTTIKLHQHTILTEKCSSGMKQTKSTEMGSVVLAAIALLKIFKLKLKYIQKHMARAIHIFGVNQPKSALHMSTSSLISISPVRADKRRAEELVLTLELVVVGDTVGDDVTEAVVTVVAGLAALAGAGTVTFNLVTIFPTCVAISLLCPLKPNFPSPTSPTNPPVMCRTALKCHAQYKWMLRLREKKNTSQGYRLKRRCGKLCIICRGQLLQLIRALGGPGRDIVKANGIDRGLWRSETAQSSSFNFPNSPQIGPCFSPVSVVFQQKRRRQGLS